MTLAELAQRNCKPATAAANEAQTTEALSALPGWKTSGGQIVKQFAFKNYYETIAFVNATAWISNQQDHHPDLEAGYNRCTVKYSTHSVGGLSENDFICAAKIEMLQTS